MMLGSLVVYFSDPVIMLWLLATTTSRFGTSEEKKVSVDVSSLNTLLLRLIFATRNTQISMCHI
jgi:hypothetical protein